MEGSAFQRSRAAAPCHETVLHHGASGMLRVSLPRTFRSPSVRACMCRTFIAARVLHQRAAPWCCGRSVEHCRCNQEHVACRSALQRHGASHTCGLTERLRETQSVSTLHLHSVCLGSCRHIHLMWCPFVSGLGAAAKHVSSLAVERNSTRCANLRAASELCFHLGGMKLAPARRHAKVKHVLAFPPMHYPLDDAMNFGLCTPCCIRMACAQPALCTGTSVGVHVQEDACRILSSIVLCSGRWSRLAAAMLPQSGHVVRCVSNLGPCMRPGVHRVGGRERVPPPLGRSSPRSHMIGSESRPTMWDNRGGTP